MTSDFQLNPHPNYTLIYNYLITLVESIWGKNRFVISKDIINRHYTEQNCYLKILIGYNWENDGRGGSDGLVVLQSTFDYEYHYLKLKKRTKTSDWQYNESLIGNTMSPFQSLYNRPFYINLICPRA
jgi:hypothetical protein